MTPSQQATRLLLRIARGEGEPWRWRQDAQEVLRRAHEQRSLRTCSKHGSRYSVNQGCAECQYEGLPDER